MNYPIQEVEDIGPAYAAKLAQAEIRNTRDLLEHCATRSGREVVSTKTGISSTLILTWANQADLMRLTGVGPQFAELLQAAGVDTIRELRQRNSANLETKLEQVNQEKNLAKTSPKKSQIDRWIEQARFTEAALSY